MRRLNCSPRLKGVRSAHWRRTIVLVWLALLMLPGVCFPQQQVSQRQSRPRRLFFGAPPTIPHEAGAEMNDCLACHGVKDSGAPVTPHPTRLSCRQCHVPADDKAGDFRVNSFSGLAIPGPAPRVSPGAPPVMAHPVLLHENCLACHMPGARTDVISTPHPQRERCQQCHIPIRAQVASWPRTR